VNLRQRGNKAVMHGLRGGGSNCILSPKRRQEIVRIWSEPVHTGFGPTLAAGVSGEPARDHGGPGNGPEADERQRTVAEQAAAVGGNPSMALAAQPIRRDGAVGHLRPRLAVEPGAKAEAMAAQARSDGELLHGPGRSIRLDTEAAARPAGRGGGPARHSFRLFSGPENAVAGINAP
jgi:hypothetical protein